MPALGTRGGLSARGFGFGASAQALNIADLFDIDLWTGNGTSQSITTPFGPDMVWIKERSSTENHALFDTTRGATKYWSSNTTTAETTNANTLTAFSGTGYALGSGGSLVNTNTATYVGWAFKEAARFYDVVTYTGDGVPGRQIAHSLGTQPGIIIVHGTSTARDNPAWQRTLADGTYLKLNATDALITNTSFQVFGDASGQTSSVFTVGKVGSSVNGLTNANGDTYVAYLFAHDTASDGVIYCDSFTTDGSGNATVTIGWEPQWVLIKASSATDSWIILDQTRGWGSGNDAYLLANTSATEATYQLGAPTSTGFTFGPYSASTTFVYMAIRKP